MRTPLRAPRSLTGRLILITGGGRGIGRATAAALAGHGARVWIADLDGELATRTAAELGHGVVGIRLDVTDHAAFTRALDELERAAGPLDVLINNAGVMAVEGFVDGDGSAERLHFDVNVFAVMHGTREALRRMLPRGRGQIVNVASLAGVVPTPGAASYSASKHAVVGFCEALRWELRGSGVDLGYVLPALVNTELAGGVRRSWAATTIEPEDVAERIVGALRRPRTAVFAPAGMRLATALSAVTPRAIIDGFVRLSGSDRLLSDSLGSPERTAYAARIRTPPRR